MTSVRLRLPARAFGRSPDDLDGLGFCAPAAGRGPVSGPLAKGPHLAQALDGGHKVGGDRRCEPHLSAMDRVPKAEFPGMQSRTSERVDSGSGRRVSHDPSAAIDVLSDQGMTRVGEMDSDLVGATGFEVNLDGSHAGIDLEDFVVGHGGLALTHPRGESLSMMGVSSVQSLEGSGLGARNALRECEIRLLDFSLLKALHQARVGFGGLRKNDDARRSSVEPVDDAGANRVRVGECAEVVKHPGEERSVLVAVSRMDNTTCGLVDDKELGVLVEDLERQRFRLEGERNRFGGTVFDMHPNLEAGALAAEGGLPIDGDRALFEVLFELIAADRKPLRNDLVQATAVVLVLDGQLEGRPGQGNYQIFDRTWPLRFRTSSTMARWK